MYNDHMESKNYNLATWLVRAAVGIVFAVNIWCALSFILQPQVYAGNFELTGLPREIVVQSFGILFLMWNATYPPVILRPNTHRTLFSIILVQQCIGLTGETWLLFKLPSGHPELYSTGLRFIVFDGLGLFMMGATLIYLRASARRKTSEGS
jgi:hypothetical protein